MYEQLDDDLNKRIEEFFENIETPTADEGWLLLRKKFPAKEKRLLPIFWYRLGAAALLFILLGISFLIFKDQTHHVNLATQANKYKSNKASNNVELNKKVDPQTQLSNNRLTNLTDTLNDQVNLKNKRKVNENINGNTKNLLSLSKYNTLDAAHHSIHHLVPKSGLFSKNENLSNSSSHKNKQPNSTNFLNEDIGEKSDLVSQSTERMISEELKAKNLGYMLNIQPKNFEVKMPKEQKEKPNQSFYTILASSKTNYQEDSEELDNIASKKVGFAIYEATYLNYAKGSNNQVNLGLGLTADIYITKNIKLITGINIGKNSFDYSTSSILNSSQNLFANAQVQNTSTIAPKGFTPATQLKAYNVGLVGLDIPLNLKYDLEGKRNNYYVVAGVSSGTFINETYSYQYTYQNSSAPLNQQTQDSNSVFHFSFVSTIRLYHY